MTGVTTTESALSPIRIENLSVDISSQGTTRRILHDVSLEVRPGEVLALVGESGSGKSVTAMSVMRLLPPQIATIASGEIRVNGVDVAPLPANSPTVRSIRGAEVAMVFQEPMTSLNPVTRVGDQIAEMLLAHTDMSRKEALAEAVELIRRVGIPEPEQRARSFPHQLSGGMRQRIMIAIAIACKPKVLIADEATTALDVTTQQQILDMVTDWVRESGSSLICVTHNLGVVARYADRICVMKDGRIQETGSVFEVFETPKVEYTRDLLSAVPRLDGATIAAPLPADADVVLRVEGLDVTFHTRDHRRRRTTVEAVRDVSFEVRRGETLSIVGESGSGKTTVGKSLLGLVPEATGSVDLMGTPILGRSRAALRAARRDIAFIFQDPMASFDPRQTVAKAVTEPLRLRGGGDRADERFAELMRLVGLPANSGERYPHEFSGGQRQRLAIARALAGDPALIICDEPVSALDVSIQAQIVDLLTDLQRRIGMSLLFISHDLAVVKRMSHRIAVMQRGRIVEEGPADQVVSAPTHPYTRALLEAVPIPDPTIERRRRPR